MVPVICALFGLMIGSFLNALIYRLPREINIVFPRSACTHCKKKIYWYENIPILSFVILRGKCSHCGKKISWRYPIVETITAIVSVLLAPHGLEIQYLLPYVFYFSVFCCFLAHFLIDWEHQILPDGINIYLALLFIAYVVMDKPWTHWAIGGSIGILLPLLVTWIFYLWRGLVGLGGGDIKLYGALGLYLGPMGIISNIFLSCLVGSFFGLSLLGLKRMKKSDPIPFGPFIIIVASWQIFFPDSFSRVMSWLTEY
ncbi:MAG: prepilin peptidase [Pseudomonadota bacterium]